MDTEATPTYDSGSIAWILVMKRKLVCFASTSDDTNICHGHVLILVYVSLNVDVDSPCFFDGKHCLVLHTCVSMLMFSASLTAHCIS